ncbi:MAG: radical SAM protein [Candidatus Diapherotrites archaeon]|nr:radical SAM protein [Candidatus Diapherotrites archaeon]
MKVLFLNPPAIGGKSIAIDPILSRCSGVPAKAPYLWPPIGLAYLAAYAQKQTRAEISILDAQAEGVDEQETVKKSSGYGLVFFNASTPTIERDVALCNKIASKGPKTAFLGAHTSHFWQSALENSLADFAVLGEPERPVVNLIKAVESGKIREAKGIAWKKKGKAVKNTKAKPVEDLDLLPFAARDLLPEGKYYDILIKGKKLGFVISSRGCPFRCRFCSANASGSKYRARNAKNVLAEIKGMQESGVDDVTFYDDSFTIDRKRVLGICKGLKGKEINWRCLSRADTVDRKMLEEMKRAGCYQVMFGVESGSQEMLDKMNKGTDLGKIRETFKNCNELGIETAAFFVLGFPGETTKSIEKTISFAKELDADFASFNAFTPFPGSDIFEEFGHSGKNWQDYDFTSKSFCDIPTGELQAGIRKAYRAFYFRPGYLAGRLKKAGIERTVRQNLLFWAKRKGVLWEKGIK